MLLVGDVELEHRRLGRQPLGDPPGDAERPAEVGDQHRRALLLGDLRGREADRGVQRDAGDQDPLAVEDAHAVVLLLVVRCHVGIAAVAQWPMPRPPSTGMTAPVM